MVLKAVNFFNGSGKNFLSIAAQFSEYERLKSSNQSLQVQNFTLEGNARQLEEKARICEEIIESKSQMQWLMVKLEATGFGFKQLKRLYNIIDEITEANGFSETDGYAVRIFLDQVERNYDNLLGFEKQTEDLKTEINNLQIQRLSQVNIISAHPYVGGALARLLNSGLREDQILKLASQSEIHPEKIQSLLRDRISNKREQQIDNDSKKISSFFSSPSLSTQPNSPPTFQQQSDQTSTTPTPQKPVSTASLAEKYDTSKTSTKPYVDTMASFFDKKSDSQSFASPLLDQQSPMKDRDSSGAKAAAAATPKQIESTHRDESSQFIDTKPKKENRNQDQVNSTLAVLARRSRFRNQSFLEYSR